MYTTEWFRATKPGAYHLFCAQYCGTNHSHMIGTVYVMKDGGLPAVARRAGAASRWRVAGEKLYQRLGCAQLPRRHLPDAERPLHETGADSPTGGS